MNVTEAGTRRALLLVDVAQPGTPKTVYVVRHGEGRPHVHSNGRIKRASLQERAEYARRVAGDESWCPCDSCIAERTARHEASARDRSAAVVRELAELDEDAPRRERVL